MVMSVDDDYEVFKDCLSVAVLEQYSTKSPKKIPKRDRKGTPHAGSSTTPRVAETSENDPAELAEFVEYLSTEVFSALPIEAKTLSYTAVQNDLRLADRFSTPLSISIRESLLQCVSPSVTDTLTAYTLISPPKTDLLTFFTPVFNSYTTSVTIPPPAWHTTRPSACEICGRDWIPLSYHHLIPKAVHAKVLKRGWHEEHMLNKVAWLCRACHCFVHRMASNEELAREWHDVERILEREDVQRWMGWVGVVRWKKR